MDSYYDGHGREPIQNDSKYLVDIKDKDSILYSTDNVVLKVRKVVPESDINIHVRNLADELLKYYFYRSIEPFFLIMMNGALPFAHDLLRYYKGPRQYDSIKYQTYENNHPNLEIPFNPLLIPKEVNGRHVIILDDVADTMNSLTKIKTECINRYSPLSVKTCVFANKRDCHDPLLGPDYFAVNITGDPFLIGYGMDYNGLHRMIPSIYELLETNDDTNLDFSKDPEEK